MRISAVNFNYIITLQITIKSSKFQNRPALCNYIPRMFIKATKAKNFTKILLWTMDFDTFLHSNQLSKLSIKH